MTKTGPEELPAESNPGGKACGETCEPSWGEIALEARVRDNCSDIHGLTWKEYEHHIREIMRIVEHAHRVSHFFTAPTTTEKL